MTLRLTVLGRSPARPNPGEACAGYLVEAAGSRVLVDIGPGIVAQLLLRHHPDELDAVIVSHMHADHMLDLVTLRYVYPWRRLAADERLRIIMPPGSADQLLDLARGVGGPRHFEDAFQLSEHDGSSTFRSGKLEIQPRETQHYIPCWGFRFSEGGRVLSYTADTAPCSGLDELADGAHLLLSEATLRSLAEDAQPPEPRGHLLPAEAAEAARLGGADRLVLTHLPVNHDEAKAFQEQAREVFPGTVEIATPGRTYDV